MICGFFRRQTCKLAIMRYCIKSRGCFYVIKIKRGLFHEKILSDRVIGSFYAVAYSDFGSIASPAQQTESPPRRWTGTGSRHRASGAFGHCTADSSGNTKTSSGSTTIADGSGNAKTSSGSTAASGSDSSPSPRAAASAAAAQTPQTLKKLPEQKITSFFWKENSTELFHRTAGILCKNSLHH